jgi:hypothetical protein
MIDSPFVTNLEQESPIEQLNFRQRAIRVAAGLAFMGGGVLIAADAFEAKEADDSFTIDGTPTFLEEDGQAQIVPADAIPLSGLGIGAIIIGRGLRRAQ